MIMGKVYSNVHLVTLDPCYASDLGGIERFYNLHNSRKVDRTFGNCMGAKTPYQSWNIVCLNTHGYKYIGVNPWENN